MELFTGKNKGFNAPISGYLEVQLPDGEDLTVGGVDHTLSQVTGIVVLELTRDLALGSC